MVKELDSLSWHSNDEETGCISKLNNHGSLDSQREGAIVLQQADESENCPTFGNISISNGSDIHFGNKTYYQGPVTIKQFVVTDGDKLKKISESEVSPGAAEKLNLSNLNNGVDNPGYQEEVRNEKNEEGGFRETSELPANDQVQVVHPVEDFKTFFIRYRIPALSIATLLMILPLLTLLQIKPWKNSEIFATEHNSNSEKLDDEHSHNTPIEGPIDPHKIKPLKLKIVERLEWLAQPPRHPADPLKIPVPYVIICHTATEPCSSQAQCVFQVRYIQTFHIESRGWWDIGYNFLIGGDGEVYNGRGWDKEGAHTFGYNKLSIGIAFVGTFIDNLPNQNQLLACKRLIERGVELGYIMKNYTLLGARQLQTSQSPGNALFEELKKWPHWSEKF